MDKMQRSQAVAGWDYSVYVMDLTISRPWRFASKHKSELDDNLINTIEVGPLQGPVRGLVLITRGANSLITT